MKRRKIRRKRGARKSRVYEVEAMGEVCTFSKRWRDKERVGRRRRSRKTGM